MNLWLKSYNREVSEVKKILVEMQYQDTGRTTEYARFLRVISGMYNEIIRLQELIDNFEKQAKEKKIDA